VSRALQGTVGGTTPDDFVPVSGALWKATRASAEKGRIAWTEIVENLTAAIREEMPADGRRVSKHLARIT